MGDSLEGKESTASYKEQIEWDGRKYKLDLVHETTRNKK